MSHAVQRKVKQTLLENKKAFPHRQVMSHSFCAMYGVAIAVWRRTITVDPQGTGHDREIRAVSAATESMTPVCKHQACAGTGLMLQPKDTTLSLLLNHLHSERDGEEAERALMWSYLCVNIRREVSMREKIENHKYISAIYLHLCI